MKRVYKFKDGHFYITRKRLDYAEKWIKGFLEIERQIAISDKVTQSMKAESPIAFRLSQLLMLPTICLSNLKKYLYGDHLKNVKRKYDC